MKNKIMTALCACLLAGSVAMAAAPAAVTDAPQYVQTRADGSSLTVKYPAVTVPGNPTASQLIMQYFMDEQAKAAAFFNKEAVNGMKMTEEKSYTVTLNNGKYLSFIDQGYIYYDKAAHPTSWKNGVTFDMETGKRVAWQDIIRPEDAKAFSLKNINMKIFTSKHVLSSYFNGLTELPKNYYLDKNQTIHFIFNQYEIAPYSSGIIDIPMNKKAK